MGTACSASEKSRLSFFCFSSSSLFPFLLRFFFVLLPCCFYFVTPLTFVSLLSCNALQRSSLFALVSFHPSFLCSLHLTTQLLPFTHTLHGRCSRSLSLLRISLPLFCSLCSSGPAAFLQPSLSTLRPTSRRVELHVLSLLILALGIFRTLRV
ncbi:hypothetical protein BDY24DRAFT_386368 [Mrakia frigida]|uniref:uncharacterized protein n=1 Tax=Mrakia frigida TaxID=29902 RepID=UPI003FCBF8B5